MKSSKLKLKRQKASSPADVSGGSIIDNTWIPGLQTSGDRVRRQSGGPANDRGNGGVVRLKRSRPLLGTFVEIELQAAASEQDLQGWISAGFQAIEEVDRLMSVYRSDSDITRLNQAAPGDWIALNPHTLKVLQASNTLFKTSNGVFDIRCGCVPADEDPPLVIDEKHAQKTGPWQFDLGGIAKGYAVDHAVETLQHLAGAHLTSGSVNAGGDLRVWGLGPVPAATQIQGAGGFWLRPFVIQETAAATSTVRSRTDERLTSAVHRLMPSGVPLESRQTVTVFATQCLWADALTKIVLMASDKIARACLASYHAKALVFAPNGGLQTVMG